MAPLPRSTPPHPVSVGDGTNKELSLVPLPLPSSSSLEMKERKKRKAVNDVDEPSKAVVPVQQPYPLGRKAQNEADYAAKQLELFRAGEQLNDRKPRKLIPEKVGEGTNVVLHHGRSLQNKTHPVSEDQRRQLETLQAKRQRVVGGIKPLLFRKTLTAEQLTSIDHAKTVAPNFLGRTASMTRGCKLGQYHRRTSGLTARDVLLPSADARQSYTSHRYMTDFLQGELIYMIGNHLKWKDLKGYEFLSYSKDPLFLVVHSLRRYHEAQGDVTIQFLDLRKAKTIDGNPASFYNALGLYTALDVPKWQGWDKWSMTKLHPRKFTQGFLTHGPVLVDNPALKPARVQDLIKDGLYEISPDFDAPDNHKRAGLYTLQVVLRKIGYPPPYHDQKRGRKLGPIYSYDQCSRVIPMTLELLQIVRKVTLNFCNIPEGSEESAAQPPLQIFIWFLTFQKRQRHDPVFETWIKEHYTGTFPSMTLHSMNSQANKHCLQAQTSQTYTPTPQEKSSRASPPSQTTFQAACRSSTSSETAFPSSICGPYRRTMSRLHMCSMARWTARTSTRSTTTAII